MNTRGEQRGEFTAKLWLFLLRTGGRCRSKEVAERTGEQATLVSQLLSAMASAGYVRQFPVVGMERRFAYGVTPACKVPTGVTVQQVADCVMTQSEDAEAT